jgi:hypothetical protein
VQLLAGVGMMLTGDLRPLSETSGKSHLEPASMMVLHRLAGTVAALLILVASVAPGAATTAEGAKADDVAKFLAGLAPSAGSPLAPLTRDGVWQQHSRALNQAWARLDQQRLAKIRAWSAANVTDPKPVVFYMFSGPDFLHVDAFFPDRTTYVMSGLEPVGQIPTVAATSRGGLGSGLAGLRASIGSVMNYSFFMTQEMRGRLTANSFKGVLPVLYLFIARAGKTVHEVTLISIDSEGAVVAAGTPNAAPGVKIVFSGGDGKMQTLYYVQTDVSDGGLRRSGFLKFCEQLGAGDGFIKSASYLLHSDSFSGIRNFLLDRTATLIQDDSGIPVRFFKTEEWRLQPFGRYLRPIPLFSGRYQTKLSDVYRRSKAPPIDFGVGYRWRPHESNLLMATKAAMQSLGQVKTGQR